MNREDIIRMAREAGIANSWDLNWQDKIIERFAALIASAEREACADLCKEMYLSGDMDTGLAEEAIRARGDGITLTTIRHPRGKPALGDLNPESLETVEIDLPEREWVSPTDKEIEAIWEVAMFANYGVGAELSNQPFVHYARAIEAKLKEKNHDK